jgi:UDP-N-acetyl-D-mannosaminuronate dehydrogenase
VTNAVNIGPDYVGSPLAAEAARAGHLVVGGLGINSDVDQLAKRAQRFFDTRGVTTGAELHRL